MSDYRRARRLLAYVLAVPVFALVYIGAFGTRVWAALRPAVATFLGATVIGTVYADEALKRAPATPIRAAAALALAVALVGPGMAPAPAAAASDPMEAVIAAARGYLGHGFELGAEGPKQFDCSGLVYRAFQDSGELPRIGGMRLRAVGYLRWFVARGLFTKDQDKASRGDLVVWNQGEHIGIYLGDGKAISALIDPWGVSVHSLNGIHQSVDYFLKVDWSDGNGPGDGNGGNPPPPDPGAGPGNGDSVGSGDNTPPDNGGGNDNPGVNPDPGTGAGNGDQPGQGNGSGNPGDGQNNPGSGDPPTINPDSPQQIHSTQAYSTGTLNMRSSSDPSASIVGWVSRGQYFKITNSGYSPSGWLWYQIRTTSGKTGWVFSYWVRGA